MAEEDQMNESAVGSPQGATIRRKNTTQTHGAEQTTHESTSGSEKYRGQSGQLWEEARERFGNLKRDTDEYVRHNPAKAVFIALGIGFILALMRRR
jgi:ElaB/YqjD/DUF883 family membrane-anchored ribosome-binding protein